MSDQGTQETQERDESHPNGPPALASVSIQDIGLHAQGTATRALWIALVVFGLSAVALFLMAFLGAPGDWATFSVSLLLASAVSSLLALVLRSIRLPIGKTLTVDERGLVVHWRERKSIVLSREKFVLSREKFVEGWYNPETQCVHLVRRGGNILSAHVPDAETATRLLERVGVDASKRTMRMRLGAVDFLNAMVWLVGPWISLYIGETIGEIAHHRGALGFPFALVFFVAGFFLVRKLFDPATLVIGVDGVIIEQGYGRRFIPFGEIKSISTAHDHVTLHLVGGDSVRARARHLETAERAAIEQRVREALKLRAHGNLDAAALAALDRGTKTGAAWREALRGVFDKDRGYRDANVTPEQIAGVMADPGAPANRRIGAAMALAQSGDTACLPKIRVAAESSANPRFRLALQAIAEGDLDHEAIEQVALEEAELEMRQRRTL